MCGGFLELFLADTLVAEDLEDVVGLSLSGWSKCLHPFLDASVQCVMLVGLWLVL